MLSQEVLHELKVGLQSGAAEIMQQHRFVGYAAETAVSTA
jgi:hypothetical protein